MRKKGGSYQAPGNFGGFSIIEAGGLLKINRFQFADTAPVKSFLFFWDRGPRPLAFVFLVFGTGTTP